MYLFLRDPEDILPDVCRITSPFFEKTSEIYTVEENSPVLKKMFLWQSKTHAKKKERFCRMNNDLINEYYVRKFRETARERAQRIGALKNREDALRYVEEVREKNPEGFSL